MARTEGKRSQSRARPSRPPVTPPPPRVNPVTVEEESTGLGRKILWVGGALVAIAALVVVGINVATEEGQESIADAYLNPNVTVEGPSLSPYVGQSPDTAEGIIAPEVQSADFNGFASSIEHDGTPKLIVFLAHWCEFCRREVPQVQNWIDQNGIPEGVEFVSVATSISEIRPNYPPDNWLRGEGWTQRVVVDDQANRIGTAYGLTAFPYYVAIDGSGQVLFRVSGEQNPSTVASFLNLLAGV